MTARYADLLRGCEADPAVAGLVLSGSQARNMATEHSDFDVYVVVREHDGRWSTSRTLELDTIVVSVEDLADTSNRWQRYSYRGAQVLLDRLDGRIAALVNAQATLTPAESDAWAREQLDGYVNFIYRAAKNRRDGRPELADLDEIEAARGFSGPSSRSTAVQQVPALGTGHASAASAMDREVPHHLPHRATVDAVAPPGARRPRQGIRGRTRRLGRPRPPALTRHRWTRECPLCPPAIKWVDVRTLRDVYPTSGRRRLDHGEIRILCPRHRFDHPKRT
jgi:Nucleotidyltransferase domain